MVARDSYVTQDHIVCVCHSCVHCLYAVISLDSKYLEKSYESLSPKHMCDRLSIVWCGRAHNITMHVNGSINDILSIIFLIYSSQSGKKIQLDNRCNVIDHVWSIFSQRCSICSLWPTNRIKLPANLPVAARCMHLFSMFRMHVLAKLHLLNLRNFNFMT